MWSLSDFYRTKEWYTFMQIIKAERLNENGELICEHCGMPIIKAYDCIGHHITELTDANVNDVEISLNPDNIMLVHHRCHNKIHNKLGYADRKIYLVYGSPLSGKNTFVKENMDIGDLVVDVDNLWQCISNCERYIKPNRLRGNVFQLRDFLIDMIRMRNGKWLNAWLIGGYPLISERERLCKSLKAREIFIDTPKDECLRRLYENPDGRDVTEWEKYIEEWWDKSNMGPQP